MKYTPMQQVEKAEQIRERLKKVKVKQSLIAEFMNLSEGHISDMLVNQKSIKKHIDTFELIISEFETTIERIKENLNK